MGKQLSFLSKEHIYLIYQATIVEFGGQPGYYDSTDGRIESILAQQYPVFNMEKYPGPFLKAAMLWYFFTKNHCFVDGNKRVGMQSAIVFLTINGYDDDIDDEDGYNKTMEIAQIVLPERDRDGYIEKLSGWLQVNFRKTRRL